MLVPPIAVAVTARWDLLRNFDFFVSRPYSLARFHNVAFVTLRMASNGMLPMSVSYVMDAPHLWLSLLTNSGILLGVFALLAAGSARRRTLACLYVRGRFDHRVSDHSRSGGRAAADCNRHSRPCSYWPPCFASPFPGVGSFFPLCIPPRYHYRRVDLFSFHAQTSHRH